METMHAAGRRSLPPVPRVSTERPPSPATRLAQARAGLRGREPDAAQQFVERLRTAATEFAEAARAESAVVREAVPPARHRRSRCRVVFRFADETESDVTFLGPTGAPGIPSRHGFDRQIRRWLAAGQHREASWLVPDADASDGLAIDVTLWLSAN
jgi:hypothetical protein